MESKFIYTMSEPQIIQEGRKYPAIFLMHGMGSNEQDLPNVVKGMENEFYIFSLRGPISQPPGYSFFTIERIGLPHRESFIRVLEDIQNFIGEAILNFQIDEKKIYLLGFSQGAILSQSLLTIMGSQLAGIVSLSGYLPKIVVEEFEEARMEQVKVFLAHGEQDQVIPFAWSEESKGFFESRGAQVQFSPYTGGHFITPQLVKEIEQYFNFV